MKALVIGSTGFIGGYFIKNLLSKNVSVKAMARNPPEANFQGSVELVKGDVLAPATLSDAVKGMDMVFNVSGVLGGTGTSDKVMEQVNVEGARNVAQVCSENKIRLVHCSSTAIYGYIDSITPVPEDYIPNPISPYQKSKYEGEKAAVETAPNLTSVVRPSLVYGPGDSSNLVKFYRMIKSRKFLFIGDGQNLVSPVFVEDVAEAIYLASKPKAAGNAYNISCAKAPTMEEFVNVISNGLGITPPKRKLPLPLAKILSQFDILNNIGIPYPLTKDRVDFLSKSLVYSIEKAKNELGYSPKTDLTTGMGKTMKWLKEAGYV